MLRTNSMPQITARLFFSLPGKSAERAFGPLPREEALLRIWPGSLVSKNEEGKFTGYLLNTQRVIIIRLPSSYLEMTDGRRWSIHFSFA